MPVGCERHADDLFVVAGKDTLHREGRVRPDCHAPHYGPRRLDQLRTADFFVTRGTQLGDDQIALLVMDEVSVLMWNQECVPPARFAGRPVCLPQPLPVRGVETTQLTIAANAVDILAVEDGGRNNRVQAVGVDFAVAVPLPHDLGALSISRDLDHPRAVVKRRDEDAVIDVPRRGDRQSRLGPNRGRPTVASRSPDRGR